MPLGLLQSKLREHNPSCGANAKSDPRPTIPNVLYSEVGNLRAWKRFGFNRKDGK